MKKRRQPMSIKRKVFLGFVVLAMILLFSSVVAIFEFNKINSTTSGIIEDNIASINTARDLLQVSETYNLTLLSNIPEETFGSGTSADYAEFEHNFADTFDDIKTDFSTRSEQQYADSVLFAYTAYMQVVREAPQVWELGYDYRRDWYFNRLQPFYLRLRGYIQKLTSVSQEALARNSQMVQDTFYRSIMPAVASVAVGIIVVLLFNIFINFYIINPLLKITKGVRNYLSFRKPYTVTLENEDELKDLNDCVSELITDHRSATSKQ